MTKTELLEAVSSGSELSKKEVNQVLEALGGVIASQLSKKGEGVFILPGLLKITRVTKPARKAGMKPNPFKPGEMMEVKARPGAQRRQGASAEEAQRDGLRFTQESRTK